MHSEASTGLTRPHTKMANKFEPINMVGLNVVFNVSKLGRCFPTLTTNPQVASCDLIYISLQIGFDQCLQV